MSQSFRIEPIQADDEGWTKVYYKRRMPTGAETPVSYNKRTRFDYGNLPHQDWKPVQLGPNKDEKGRHYYAEEYDESNVTINDPSYGEREIDLDCLDEIF